MPGYGPLTLGANALAVGAKLRRRQCPEQSAFLILQ